MPIHFLAHCLLPSVVIFLSLSNAYAAAALTFNVTLSPQSCYPLTVDWTGGTPPFKLIVITPGLPSLTFSIPDANFQAGTAMGSFTLPQLKVAVNKMAMFGIADASGFATKLSEKWMVDIGPSQIQCDTTPPAPVLPFSVDDEVKECQVVTFGLADSGATRPVTVYAFLPGYPFSKVVALQGTTSLASYGLRWVNDFPGGTQVAFSIMDAQGRLGGTSEMKTIVSGDKSCLTNSTSTTTGTLPATPTSAPNPTQTPSQALPIAAIAGGAAGGAVVLTAVALLLFFLFCKRTRPTLLSRKPEFAHEMLGANIVTPFRGRSRPKSLPLDSKARLDQSSLSGSQFPLITPSAESASGYQNYQHENPFLTSSDSSHSLVLSQSQRVIVHRDITETGREGQMLELPPQYSAVRAPIPGLPSGEPSPSPSPTRPGRRKGRT